MYSGLAAVVEVVLVMVELTKVPFPAEPPELPSSEPPEPDPPCPVLYWSLQSSVGVGGYFCSLLFSVAEVG